MTAAPTCRWYRLCTNEASGEVDHPMLGPVPVCTRCAQRFGLQLLPLAGAR